MNADNYHIQKSNVTIHHRMGSCLIHEKHERHEIRVFFSCLSCFSWTVCNINLLRVSKFMAPSPLPLSRSGRGEYCREF